MREQGLNAQVLSGEALNTLEFWSITGDAGGGLLFTFAPDPRSKPEAKKIVDQFKADGYDPEGYTLYTYATIQIWAEAARSEEHTSELQSLMRISYAVFCLKKKKRQEQVRLAYDQQQI